MQGKMAHTHTHTHKHERLFGNLKEEAIWEMWCGFKDNIKMFFKNSMLVFSFSVTDIFRIYQTVKQRTQPKK